MRAGVFTGYAFDACRAPSTASLQAWSASPYRALGIYIGGVNRACAQPNLTPQWVQDTTALGWSLLPLYVGLQAPCVGQSGLSKVSTTLATAASQGRAAADDAVAKAQALGLPAGSPLWFDMEGYHVGNAACTAAVRAFVSSWDDELRAVGFVPGIYGSAASTIRDVAALATPPDLAWIANWNGVESVFGDRYVSDAVWANHQRVHQYKGGHNETYGGVTINVDSNIVDSAVVGGIAPPPPPPTPVPAGQVSTADGVATASWPAAAFPVPAAVTISAAPQPPDPNGYAVQLVVTETDNQAPLDGFGAPVTVHIAKPSAGLDPRVLDRRDGVDADRPAHVRGTDEQPAHRVYARRGRHVRDPDARARLVRAGRRRPPAVGSDRRGAARPERSLPHVASRGRRRHDRLVRRPAERQAAADADRRRAPCRHPRPAPARRRCTAFKRPTAPGTQARRAAPSSCSRRSGRAACRVQCRSGRSGSSTTSGTRARGPATAPKTAARLVLALGRVAGAAVPAARRGRRTKGLLSSSSTIGAMRGVIAALVALAALTAAAASPARPSGVQHVTLIGDSVADAIPGDDSAVAILRQGIDLDLEVAPCRRVEGDGCPYQGVRPPSAVQLVQTMGSKLGDTVIVAVGYNDFEDQYAGNIEDAINALTAAGVKRIFWLTLRAARHPYLTMNDDIAQAAARHPQVSVVDWNVYSRSHPDWFQTDGLHLLGPAQKRWRR